MSKDANNFKLKTGKKLGNPPPHLNEVGINAWNFITAALDEMGVSDRADTKAVELFCMAYEEYIDLKGVIHGIDGEGGVGRTYETATNSGEVRFMLRPEVQLAEKAWVRAKSLLPELCLTTASRVRKGGNNNDKIEEDELDEFLGKIGRG